MSIRWFKSSSFFVVATFKLTWWPLLYGNLFVSLLPKNCALLPSKHIGYYGALLIFRPTLTPKNFSGKYSASFPGTSGKAAGADSRTSSRTSRLSGSGRPPRRRSSTWRSSKLREGSQRRSKSFRHPDLPGIFVFKHLVPGMGGIDRRSRISSWFQSRFILELASKLSLEKYLSHAC